jgi:hypothetical protein
MHFKWQLHQFLWTGHVKLEYLLEWKTFQTYVVEKNGLSTTVNTELKSPTPKQTRLTWNLNHSERGKGGRWADLQSVWLVVNKNLSRERPGLYQETVKWPQCLPYRMHKLALTKDGNKSCNRYTTYTSLYQLCNLEKQQNTMSSLWTCKLYTK